MTEAQGRVGRWLRNKWHLDSLIAIGGMAAVYASTHRNGARAAIKMLHSQYTRNEQARRRFLAEGYAANKVGHRNAVLVLDDDATEDGEVYLVMELLDGESLEGRLERVGVMSPMEVLELTDALLEVLACAHPKGILHRDIKPANIYLTRDGAVKLLDFGLARVRELSAEAMDQSDGIVFGTVSYIAPEQARADNQNLDARSDMWSIAATMFRALSGETVHPSTGPVIDRLMAVARKPPRSIASVVPHLPRQVIELVDRALAFDPENRWPSCNVMRVVVQDVMAQLREEAEAQANADDEMTGMFTRPPHGLPPPMRHRTGHDLPAVRSGAGPVAPPQQQRPKTDPVALSTRPKNLPLDDPDEVDLDVDLETAPRPEARGRRSRTLLTKEGRAELRRILDARKAGADVRLDEPTPRPAPSPVQARVVPGPSESGTADIDVEVEDSIIEVTIDHTHRARPGPIAEALADHTTPAPVRADRATGSFVAVAEDRRSAGSVPAGAEDRRSTGTFPAVADDRRSPAGAEDRRATNTFSAVPSGEQAARASGGLEDSRSRREAAAGRPVAASQPVPEDRRTAATASYPTLGGATSKPIQPQPRGDAQRPSPRDDDITRVAAVPTALAPVSGELGSRGPGEITRVGAAPAPPAPPNAMRSGPAPRAPEPVRPGATLHDTLRPKTIPPVSRPTPTPPPRPPAADSLRPPTPPPRRPEAIKPDARPAAAKPEPTPEPTKVAAQPEARQAPPEARAAVPAAKPVTPEVKPELKTSAEAARSGAKPEVKPAAVKPEPTAVVVRPDPANEPTPVPAAAQARAGLFAAPPSRTVVTPRAPASPGGPVEPQRVVTANAPDPARSPAPAPGIAGLPARGVARPAVSEPVKVEAPQQRSPAGPAAPHAAPSATQSSSGAATPAAAATAPTVAAAPAATTTKPTAATPAAAEPKPAAAPVATAKPATAAPVAATAKPATAAPAAAPAAAPVAATAKPATAAAPAVTAPAKPAAAAPAAAVAVPVAGPVHPNAAAAARTAAHPTISAEPSPVPKDSPVESAARAAAPTAAHPVVPPEEGASREPKAKAGAPTLPFSFLRPGPASRPGEPASEPPRGDGVPPRKKS
ncbi:MAG: protein kinase [Nannocystis sp.]|uniref:serine/threonine-protein kinase n=1 Tax=Nannocystis sp. TaxID=1962667 RepID=UPI0024241E6A|nr:serine/threonine protein kinase [Nannocystis sp.]MBK9755163.1 protein kinase [Nannocystis sp.]